MRGRIRFGGRRQQWISKSQSAHPANSLPNPGRPVSRTSPISSLEKVPIPFYAGQIFRDFVGDPEAARLVQKQIENKLPEVVIDKLNFLPSIFRRLGYRRNLGGLLIMVGRGVDYRGDSQPGGWKGEEDSSSVRSCE